MWLNRVNQSITPDTIIYERLLAKIDVVGTGAELFSPNCRRRCTKTCIVVWLLKSPSVPTYHKCWVVVIGTSYLHRTIDTPKKGSSSASPPISPSLKKVLLCNLRLAQFCHMLLRRRVFVRAQEGIHGHKFDVRSPNVISDWSRRLGRSVLRSIIRSWNIEALTRDSDEPNAYWKSYWNLKSTCDFWVAYSFPEQNWCFVLRNIHISPNLTKTSGSSHLGSQNLVSYYKKAAM